MGGIVLLRLIALGQGVLI